MKKLLLALPIAFNLANGLDVQGNISTLGIGISARQALSDNWGITGAVDISAMSDTLSDIKFTGYTRNTLYNNNHYNLTNTSYGLGVDYAIFNTKPLWLSTEFGLKYNSPDYENTGSSTYFDGSHTYRLVNNDNMRLDYNVIAPYAQVNIRAYVTDNFFIAGQLGLEWYNMRLVSNSTHTDLVTKQFLPIAGIGVGYSF